MDQLGNIARIIRLARVHVFQCSRMSFFILILNFMGSHIGGSASHQPGNDIPDTKWPFDHRPHFVVDFNVFPISWFRTPDFFLFIQIVDNVLVQPVVVAKSVDLHPLMVMVVVMIGSDLWGMVGMLIAVPVTGILKVSATTVYEGLQGYRVS